MIIYAVKFKSQIVVSATDFYDVSVSSSAKMNPIVEEMQQEIWVWFS